MTSERADGDQRRRQVDFAKAADPGPELVPGVVAFGLRPRELWQFADDDVDCSPCEESRDHRFRQELSDPSEPKGREQDEQQAGREGDRRDELRGLGAAELGGEHRGSGDRCERGTRARGDLARRAEERVDDSAGRRRIEPVLQGHPRDLGVAEVLGHHERRNRKTRYDVGPQPTAVVVGKPLDRRHESSEAPDGDSQRSGRSASRCLPGLQVGSVICGGNLRPAQVE